MNAASLLCAALIAAPAFAQTSGGGHDFLVQIPGIEGESEVEAGAIDALSFSWGVQNVTSTPTGGGGGAGKATFSDLNFVKKVDASSPALMRAAVRGEHLPEVVLVARRGARGQQYLKVTMSDVLVTSFQPSGSASNGRPVESVALSYGRISLEYREQKANGTLGPAVVTCWDLRANRSCD